jgi:hypothetical protein
MRHSFWAALCCSTALTGCTFFGYYKHEKAVWATPEEAARVEFPNSFDGGTSLTGPMVAALNVAMKEFRPPGSKVKVNDGDERLARCLSQWETFDTSVIQAGDNLFFVRFFPDISRCGIHDIILDAGAVYAVDGQGRILDMQ